MANALNRSDWLVDQRFVSRDSRKQFASELSAEIEQELLKQSAEDWEKLLQHAGVPCARLRSLPEALASEQVEHRGYVYTLGDGTSVPTLPFRLGGTKAHVPTRTAPRLGENSSEILAWLEGEEK